MRATAKIDTAQIDAMFLDITFRMTVAEWRAVMRQTPDAWPSGRLGQHISSVLGHITKSTKSTEMVFEKE